MESAKYRVQCLFWGYCTAVAAYGFTVSVAVACDVP